MRRRMCTWRTASGARSPTNRIRSRPSAGTKPPRRRQRRGLPGDRVHVSRRRVGRTDAEEAARRFAILADNGSAHAKAALAHLYLFADDVHRHVARAFTLYREAAEQGVTDAYTGPRLPVRNRDRHGRGPRDRRELVPPRGRTGRSVGPVPAGSLIFQPTQQDKTATALYWFERAASTGHLGGENNAAWILATSRHDRIRNGALRCTWRNAPSIRPRIPARSIRWPRPMRRTATSRAPSPPSAAPSRPFPLDTENLRAELAGRLAKYEAREPWRE